MTGMFSSVEREDVRPDCPYLLGTGNRSCNSGCLQEPVCITGEPWGGWLDPQHNPPNPILVALRIDEELMDDGLSTDDRIREYLATMRGCHYDEYGMDAVSHATKVLTRIANLNASRSGGEEGETA